MELDNIKVYSVWKFSKKLSDKYGLMDQKVYSSWYDTVYIITGKAEANGVVNFLTSTVIESPNYPDRVGKTIFIQEGSIKFLEEITPYNTPKTFKV